jgi:hypothetical protein
VEKYGRVGQATDDKIIWRVFLPSWIVTDTEKPSKYLMLPAFPQQNWLRERA